MNSNSSQQTEEHRFLQAEREDTPGRAVWRKKSTPFSLTPSRTLRRRARVDLMLLVAILCFPASRSSCESDVVPIIKRLYPVAELLGWTRRLGPIARQKTKRVESPYTSNVVVILILVIDQASLVSAYTVGGSGAFPRDRGH